MNTESFTIELTEKDKRANSRKASRESSFGEPRFKHKVHKSQKSYNRQKSKQIQFEDDY